MEADSHRGGPRPLYDTIVSKARELNLAGATALRGVMGFGAHSRLHPAKLLRLSEDLPVVVEIMDTEKNLQRILPCPDEHVPEGLITMEKVRVIQYCANRQKEDTERA